ncbi:MAG: cardiolipin synthase [Planctomycetota bacterium]
MTVVLSILFTAAGYLIGLALVPKILVQRREHGATIAWLLAIIFLPYVGALLYWSIGGRRIRFRQRRRTRAIQLVAPGLAASTQCVRRFESTEPGATVHLPEPALALARIMDRLEKPSCSGNAVEVLLDAEATFSRIHSAIESAESHVHVEYYIWRNDETGRALRDVLVKVAKAGVEVRVLVDDVGSRQADKKFFRPLLDAGGKVGRFLPVNLLARRLVINHRNHRKIVVVDGRVAFTGGLNVGDEYFGRDPVAGRWRDTHLRIEGPGALRLQEVFVEDWAHATDKDLTAAKYFPDPVPSGDQRVHILTSGPDERHRSIATVYFTGITLAREKVWLTTPYFVPDPPLVAALETAALRGVDVRLLVPGKLDEPIILHAARSFYPELLAAGVHVYEYDDTAMLHAKTATIDGCWSTIGTANLDLRSFYLNFEVNAVVYGSSVARELERAFERDIATARRVELAEFGRSRPWKQRAIEGAARLLSPLL